MMVNTQIAWTDWFYKCTLARCVTVLFFFIWWWWFLSALGIHWKAMYMTLGGAVFLPDDKHRQTYTEKSKRKKEGEKARNMVQTLIWKQLSFLPKATEDSDSLRVWGGAFQSLGAEVEKVLKLNCFSLWFSSTLKTWRQDWEDYQRGCGGS